MSNYNTTLQSNNTDLQAILNTINELPEAGSGEQATPVISVDSSSGLITATAGTKSSTHQLAFQPAKTITPSTTDQTAISSGYYTGGNITVKGDSNLVAGNIKAGVSIFGVSGTLESGGSSGDEDGLIAGTLINYTNSGASSVKHYAFYRDSNLATVSFTNAKSIGSYAFEYCSKLITVSFPVCTSIGSYAFEYCSKLTTVSFPVCTSIGGYAFEYCSNLTTVSFSKVKSIANRAFGYCQNLTTVSMPSCQIIEWMAFAECSNLTAVNFPACRSINAQAFTKCSNLTTASFPKVTTISNQIFNQCRTLSQLYLAGSSMCNLYDSNAFQSTPYAGYSSYFSGTPCIYVPASLVSSYQTATNWVYFSSYFRAIEDNGHGGGGTN